MKKEVILILTLIFLTGCAQQEEGLDFSKAQTLIEWSETLPVYYYSEPVPSQYQSQINLALETQNEKDCENIVLPFIGKEPGIELNKKIEIMKQCNTLLIKKKAFLQKNIPDCNGLYDPDNDNTDYEECVAPIAAFLAIANNDMSRCERNLNNEELINICEDDYEKFS